MMKSFIETQFPVSKVSKESYKERMANYSQTLTGLGKWWGRKPLILIRAALIGLLMPASSNPVKDREIFLKLLTMDEGGLLQRKNKNIPLKVVYQLLTPRERERWFKSEEPESRPRLKRGTSAEERKELQQLVFGRLSYDEKLTYCARPEQIDGPAEKAWSEINAHLGTNAQSLPELVHELGERQFGHVPRVGDAFCGGGSVPFEAARLGCEAYGSDLNPVAALLTWASLNIVGGGPEVAEEVRQAQREVYEAVDRQVVEWGIEHNEEGWRADAYLYCNEVVCPECGWRIPLAPSWVIGEKSHCVAKLRPNEELRCYDILIEEGVSQEEMQEAKEAGTVRNSALICPHCDPNGNRSIPITMLRGDRRTGEGTQYGLRLWENEDIVPRPDDVFQERLYCIRWVETYFDEDGNEVTERYYLAPDEKDMQRERKVLELLQERFYEWQEKGYIPSRRIEPGYNTNQPIRERGWIYWHHLFNPRQLLVNGLFFENIFSSNRENNLLVALMLFASKCCDYNAKLSRWHSHGANEKSEQVFSNQALNTLFNYGVRTVYSLNSAFFSDWPSIKINQNHKLLPLDARVISSNCDFWLTDPPYADAINYHELSEFFLAWYGKHVPHLFPGWYADSKRALAITGTDENFRRSMVDSYRNLAEHMPDNGVQIVMFTHQDAGVWADLALILWAAGLRVTAAWCIATETDSALREGNYVKGTVLLVLRKQTSDETAFIDEIYHEVEVEVERQLDDMLALDDQEDPNFGDTDYQLAAYAAALRVLTSYRSIEDIDVVRELSRPRQGGEITPVVEIINQAVKIACDHLVPKGIDPLLWKELTPEERFYIKGLELESHGEYRAGAYQELARGFGIREYRPLMAGTRANQNRLKTASEFAARMLGDTGFDVTLVRQVLFAVRETVRTGETITGRNWLKNELKEKYWGLRQTLIKLLQYFATLGQNKNMPRWEADADAARLLAGAVENDHV
jgi:putative DNA methylase